MNDPGRLVSLLEMLKIYASNYVSLGKDIANLAFNFHMSDCEADAASRVWTHDEKMQLTAALAEMADKCVALEMPVALAGLNRAIQDLPQTAREFGNIVSVLEDELQSKLFLFVPPERAKYHEYDLRFKAVAWASFPTAAGEMVHAGNCYAVAEDTATVFHATRAVEIALHAVQACLGIVKADGDSNNWGSILKRIRTAIDARGKRWDEKDLFDEYHAMIHAIATAWRNPTAHVDKNYTESDAERIYRVVADFIGKISSRLDEQGRPLASPAPQLP